MKNKIEVISFPVFSNYQIYVEITKDIAAALKKYDETRNVLWEENDDSDAAVSIHVKNRGLSFIFLQSNATPGTIAHEALHAVTRMMNYVGVDDDSETRSYHLGYVVDKIHKLKRGK
jgi:hypothetical protein